LAILLGVAVLAAAGGCGTRGGIYHRVRPGENLYRIGKAYGVQFEKLAQINRIGDPHRIMVGQRIFVPGATRRLPVTMITPERAWISRPRQRELPKGKRPFVWPVDRGRLTSRFGPRGGTFHDGIDIGAPQGTPVYAARGGQVIYNDQLRGYGNVIILRHGGGYASVYAHNSAHVVPVGAQVRQGQLIARVGETGRTTGPNLHFEVRKDNVARNPLYYLPRRGTGPSVGGGG
jgi:murein DD-endopeptidase MepM/ murein hydrolase activator NlpD